MSYRDKANGEERTRTRLKEKQDQNYLLTRGYLSEHPCIDCGESDVDCLDFDHRDPTLKDEGVSYFARHSYSMERVLREISKCDVRCANCHRRRHAAERRANGWTNEKKPKFKAHPNQKNLFS
jgi:hypothetical protein